MGAFSSGMFVFVGYVMNVEPCGAAKLMHVLVLGCMCVSHVRSLGSCCLGWSKSLELR